MLANLSLPDVGGFVTSFIRRNKLDLAVKPLFDSAFRHPHGPFAFSFKMANGCPYEVHASTDLKNWESIAKGVCSGEGVDYIDSEAPKFNCRFYRAFSGVLASAEVIGYVTVSIAPGFSMIANPLNGLSNSVAALLPNMPEGTSLSKFDSRQFKLTKNTVSNGRWANPHETLIPGEGAIISNPTNEFKALNFVGKVQLGKLFNPIPSGFSIRSSLVPRPGRLDTELEFPLCEGDSVHIFDRDKQQYIIYNYPDKAWEKNPPVIAVGESFWVEKTSPGNWVRNFDV